MAKEDRAVFRSRASGQTVIGFLLGSTQDEKKAREKTTGERRLEEPLEADSDPPQTKKTMRPKDPPSKAPCAGVKCLVKFLELMKKVFVVIFKHGSRRSFASAISRCVPFARPCELVKWLNVRKSFTYIDLFQRPAIRQDLRRLTDVSCRLEKRSCLNASRRRLKGPTIGAFFGYTMEKL